MASPLQLALAKLKASGLDAKDLKALDLSPIDGKSTGLLNRSFDARAAMVIPYHGLNGKVRHDKFYRLRYLEAETTFAAQTHRKEVRYTQPPDSTVAAYFPRLLKEAWSSIAAEPKDPLVITEGELKAACACKHNFPTLGLGGVFNWRSAKLNMPMLPELEAINWVERVVYIAFDSDFRTNPMVTMSLGQLAKELTNRGAKVYIVSLPDVVEGGKTGLDDFIMAKGAEAFEQLMVGSPIWGMCKDLWQLNNEVVFIRQQGLVVAQSDNLLMAPSDFKNAHYANRKTTVAVDYKDKDGNLQTKLKEVPLAPLWMSWPHRFELGKFSYDPGKERFHDNTYNSWKGWGCQPRQGDVGLWHGLLDHIFAGADPKARQWFERWCAYPIQDPGFKMFSSCLLWGLGQGTGKTMVFESLGRIYGDNYTKIDQIKLLSGFNKWIHERQFVLADDISGIGKERREAADALKGMITQDKVWVNIKFIVEFEVKDRANWGITSNQPDALALEREDRRYFVHEIVGGRMSDEFRHDYTAWIDSDQGREALHHHLKHLDLGDFDPHAPAYKTESRSSMIRVNSSDLGSKLDILKDHPDDMLKVGNVKLKHDLMTSAQLKELLDPEGRVTIQRVSLELKRAGFVMANEGKVIRTRDRLDRYWVVRDADRWGSASYEQLRAHLDGAAEKRGKF